MSNLNENNPKDTIQKRENNKSQILILYYNSSYFDFFSKVFTKNRGDYSLTGNKKHLAKADYIIIDISKIYGKVAKFKLFYHLLKKFLKRNGEQKWIACSGESEVNYPLLKNKFFMGFFDATVTYKQDSTIWTPYINAKKLNKIEETQPIPKTEKAMAAMFISSHINKSGREEIAEELMHFISIDSYGKFRNNRAIPEGREKKRSHEKMCIIAKYKFTIAFENSIAVDYVTEKFFEPLEVGSVPIYLGAPNIDEYAPNPKSFINVNNFRNIKELADYLRFLADNEHAYNEYLAWKKNGIKSPLLEKIKNRKKNNLQYLHEMICERKI